MPTSLTDQNIDETYAGLLHSQGQELPTGAQVSLYDGKGNKSSLQVGRENTGATIFAGTNENAFTVFGDISATQRATIGYIESLSGITAPNAPKAFITFNGLSQEKITGSGINAITRISTGKFKIELNSETTSILNALTDANYHINATMTIEEADLVTTNMYSIVANGLSDNNYVYVNCMRLSLTPTPSIINFDPRYVHLAIYKS